MMEEAVAQGTSVVPMRIGFIGCGRWAQEASLPYLIAQAESVNVVSASSVFPPSEAHRLARACGLQSIHQNWRDMLRREELDAVVVSTPHAHHFQQVKACLQAGLHVLVDKPPALSMTQLEELIRLSRVTGRIVGVFSQRRYRQDYSYVSHAITSNALGTITHVQGSFGQETFPDFSGSWRSDPLLSGGGILIDSGYHLVDTVFFLMKPLRPKSVMMFANCGDLESDRYTSLLIKLENEAIVSLTVIRGLPCTVADEEMRIIGTEGMIVTRRAKIRGQRSCNLTHLSNDGRIIREMSEEVVSDNAAPIKNFLEAIRQQAVLISTLEDALPTVAVIEAGYASWRQHRITELPLA